MFKRPHCCAFVLGASLVLLALVLAVRVQRTPHHPGGIAALRIAEAVTHLDEGCLTCHEPQAVQDDLLVAARPHTPSEQTDWSLVRLAVTPLQPQARAQARLIDLGQRLLRLPENAQAADAYVRTVNAVQSTDGRDPVVVQQWFLHIDQLEALLHDLENQASPYRLKQDDHRPAAAPAALVSIPQTSSQAALVAAPVRVIAAVSNSAQVQADPRQYVRSLDVVFASQRHGPPAGVTYDSVWSRRLLT